MLPDSFLSIVKSILPTSYNNRQIRKLQLIVDEVDALETKMQGLSDEELKAQTDKFRAKVNEEMEHGSDYYEALEFILPEAFATVREAAKRVLGERHYQCQVVGGISLFRGNICEMKTGEGKTLVSTLPAYLHGLMGRGVHVVTVNDYLAKRDSEWMGAVHKFLGLTVGLIHHDQDPESKRAAYHCDITYGTNNEYGFDYLRDNMAISPDDVVQRNLNFCIIDEVDSILIDEARTPLIISGPAEKSTDLFVKMAQWVKFLKPETDFNVDEKAHSVYLTDDGIAHAEKIIGVENLYAPENLKLLHHLEAALKAEQLFKRDINYVVKDNEVIIIDEFTGRMMPGRRYSDGIHGAIEAKEGVPVAQESLTYAQITFQNYFRLYDRLSGMTGTAMTEASEFAEIYDLDTLAIPTNRALVRKDMPDRIYKTKEEKYEAITQKAKELYEKGQPVLIGTISIENSEVLANYLRQEGVPCNVLNAKYHEKEAEIVQDAGQKGMITIATNMAGRGTDIKLGEGVAELGGLYIIGSERHESRRIDNQLRGRSGRQGDPGNSQFYLSLEDDLMRIFGGDRMTRMMEFVGWERGETIDSKMVTKALENAQKRVETMHFEARKHILKYDNVMNEHRKIIYEQRSKALKETNVNEDVLSMIKDVASQTVSAHINPDIPKEDWEFDELAMQLKDLFGYEFPKELEKRTPEEIIAEVSNGLVSAYTKREEDLPGDFLRHVEKAILLQTVDTAWKEHLTIMDHLKEGIGLRGYGQKDPLVEYKLEATELFNDMIRRIKEESTSLLFKLDFDPSNEIEMERNDEELQFNSTEEELEELEQQKQLIQQPLVTEKIGRNDPCPCGSGKKYKRCCGR
jgi:preprotein translocase subunit SecA